MPIEFSNRPVCSGCKTEKRETNHWYLLFLDEYEGDAPGMTRTVTVSEWDEEPAKLADACACGETCVHTLLSRWLETRSFASPLTRSETCAVQGEKHV